ncbi:MAG: hypothetical protein ACFUZC_08465 [Chthoniobacteraceae bacterium]
MFYQPKPDDLAVVEWAVTTLKVLAGDSPVITREEDCRVIIPWFENPGTADALVLGKFAHADLKTGAMRNYREQMAAYALGLMDVYFASEWTAYLLFCDQRELVTIHFTYAEANAVVGNVVITGVLPNINGFTVVEYSALPDNGQKLMGFAGIREALIMAARVPDVPDYTGEKKPDKQPSVQYQWECSCGSGGLVGFGAKNLDSCWAEGNGKRSCVGIVSYPLNEQVNEAFLFAGNEVVPGRIELPQGGAQFLRGDALLARDRLLVTLAQDFGG